MGLREWVLPLSFLFACSAGCSFPACSRGSFLACFPMALRCSAPAGSPLCRSGAPDRQRLPDGASLPADCLPCRSLLPYPLPTLFHGAPGRQLCQGAPASSSSRWLSAAAPLPAVLCADGPLPATASPQRLCQQQALSAPLPATNLIRQRKVLRFG